MCRSSQVGAFSVITNLRMELFQALVDNNNDRYNDGDRPDLPCPDSDTKTTGPCPRALEDSGVLYDNKLLGVPRWVEMVRGVVVMVMVTVFRIRQLRIRNDSCEIHPQFSSTINVCYGKYSAQDEDTRRFGPGFRK